MLELQVQRLSSRNTPAFQSVGGRTKLLLAIGNF